MNGKTVLVTTIGIGVAIGGFTTINKQIDKMRERRDERERAIQMEWHRAGYEGGYKDGFYDGEMNVKYPLPKN